MAEKQRTSKTVQAEIEILENQINQLDQQHDSAINGMATNWGGDNSKIEEQLLLIPSRKEAARRRLQSLQAELGTLEIAESWALYEAYYKQAQTHYMKQIELDAKIALVTEQLALLKRGKQDAKVEFENTIELRWRELRLMLTEKNGREFSKREQELYNKYKVGCEGYL